MNDDKVPWVLFYTMKARSKDSDAWRKTEGMNAALRELEVRRDYEIHATFHRMNKTIDEMIESGRKFREDFGKNLDPGKYLPYGKDRV